MIRIDSVVIVEGKYDKIALQSFIDATIVTTNGFGIFRDKGKRELIKLLCEKHGAVIITDSDNAGMQIRSYIKSFCNSDRIINVYIPQIPGKERRKAVPSKQGFLGVEGIDRQYLRYPDVMQRAGDLPAYPDIAFGHQSLLGTEVPEHQ